MMRAVFTLVLILGFVFFCGGLNQKALADENKEAPVVKNNPAKVQVYYFHGDRRCATCIAVGEVAQKLIAEKYQKNPNVEFVEINISKPGQEALVEKFQVAGSGLYVYANEKIENLTTFAFQYARTEPEKLQKKLIELIEKKK